MTDIENKPPLLERTPLFGAQVFIEPGQTAEETASWFKTLSDNGMRVCRIRMFESYMRKPDNSWDFSLFDRALGLAATHGIKVIGTLFPITDKTDIGGWKFPETDAQLVQFAEYIEKAVTHFKQFKALYGWVLINEPGGGLKETEFSGKMRQEWEIENPRREYNDSGYLNLVDFRNEQFERYMTSWMLNWIANEIRKHDQDVHLHVNNHDIFFNVQEYDFPYWRTFLDSLGGSAHASWHFKLFNRPDYALAMSINSEIIYSGAGPLPWFMTELQGGNNTFSGVNAMCPTAEEITQWLWINVATEAKGAIFWSLNARASGVEAGEWALLDYQHQPTERLRAIAKVNECIHQYSELFAKAQKKDFGISLLYIKESIWAENAVTKNYPSYTDGRWTGFTDLIGYYKALAGQGISANVQAIEEYDFTRDDYTGKVIILANQIAVPRSMVGKLEHFVRSGGKLIVGGLTGYFDEYMQCTMLADFPLGALLGGKISEYRYVSGVAEYDMHDLVMPGGGWQGFVKNETGTVVAEKKGVPTALENKYGAGSVIWVPTLLGKTAMQKGCAPLAKWLSRVCGIDTKQMIFDHYKEGLLMKTLVCDGDVLTMMVNKYPEQQFVLMRSDHRKPVIIFANKNGGVDGREVTICAEETMVICWK